MPEQIDFIIKKNRNRKNEKNVSALESPPETPDRFLRPYGNRCRPQYHQTPPSERPRPAYCLTFGKVTVSVVPKGDKTRLRLGKKDKLRFKSQFDQVRREGVKVAGPGMVAIVAPSPDGRIQCGVICSKKYSLLAVLRNRARRLLWESFRMLKPELSVCRVLLIPRRKMMGYDRMQATAELTALLQKLQVLAPQKSPSSLG